jgi:hypothetical protein
VLITLPRTFRFPLVAMVDTKSWQATAGPVCVRPVQLKVCLLIQ